MFDSILDIPFEFKDAPTDTGCFRGYASTFGNKDRTGDIITTGAFSKCIAEKGCDGIRMLWQHGRHSMDPVGQWTSIKENAQGLFVEGQLFMELSGATDRLLLMQRKSIQSMSIGFTIPKDGAEWDDKNGVRIIKEIDLWEISPVTFPANPRAKITTVKEYFAGVSEAYAKQIETIRDFEHFLRDVGGFSRADAKRLASEGWKAVGQRDVVPQEEQHISYTPLQDALRDALAVVGTMNGGSNAGIEPR